MFNREEHSLKRFKQLQSGGVAQLVEQRTENPCVTGSIPVLATIFVSTPVKPTGFFVFTPGNPTKYKLKKQQRS